MADCKLQFGPRRKLTLDTVIAYETVRCHEFGDDDENEAAELLLSSSSLNSSMINDATTRFARRFICRQLYW